MFDMNYCRRCGEAFASSEGHVFTCPNGHVIYANASPAVALILEDSKGRIVVLERGVDPGKGTYDLPGGFCDGNESLEAAVEREIAEEIGIQNHHYTKPVLVSSGIDMYQLAGEQIPVLSSTFYARLLDERVELQADDDAASAEFMVVDETFAATLFFPSLQDAVKKYLASRKDNNSTV
jgi:ADP-ribose pyrophosphatase YjhB (NUDIX family)